MMKEIEKYPSITIIKGTLIDKIDFQSGTIEISETDRRQYQFVFAADGAFSKVRTQMVKSFMDLQPQMRESYDYKVHYSGLGYVEVTIKSTSLDNHCLHYWPRGEFSLFGIPDAEKNQFTGDIFMPMEGDGLCFNKFTKETFEAFVKDTFPGLEMVFHLRCDEQGKIKVHQIPNVLVYPWKLGKCCLIGDAAHGMEPFIGQGLNCGLEDCNKLFNLIKQVRDEGLPVDLVQICDQMQKARKEQVEAIQLMTKANFVETAKHIDDQYFLERKKVSAYLSEKYPDLYVSQYQLVSFNRVDYSNALKMIPIEAEILGEVTSIEGISQILAKGQRVPLIESKLLKYSERTREIYQGTSADPSLHALVSQQSLFKEQFWMKFNQSSGLRVVYLSGHSMGLQPKLTEIKVAEITKEWKIQKDVMTLFRSYWFPLETKLLEQLASVVGAANTEELCLVSSLTVNLHVALSTFYSPLETTRRGIIMISPEFSSDVFAVKSWLRLYNVQDGLIEINVEDTSTANDSIVAAIEKCKDRAQLVCLSAVNYVTGQFYDVRRIAQACREHKIILILQCAHAAGSVALHLHDWQVDCAVWCSYKYLNCCQGTVGGLFIHSDHKDIEPGLKGWHGVDKSEIFNFTPTYKKKPGAQGFQMSCFDPFQYARLAASLDTIALFGGISMVEARNAELYDYVFENLAELKIDAISPRHGHGGHLAIKFDRSLKARLAEFMEARNIIVDFRDLNEKQFVMRAGFVAMYNDKRDCDAFIEALKEFMINAAAAV